MSKILLVEDDPVNARLTVRFLKLYGHEAVVTGDGLEAVTLARDALPELIMMDGELEGSAIDGWEAARRIRSDPATQSIPIIAFSARSMALERERAIEAGCDEFAGKPFDFEQMAGKIQALLSRP